jgi:hypothetical protein
MHGMRGTARPGPRREGGRKAFSAILDGLEAPPSPSAKDSANSERQTAR